MSFLGSIGKIMGGSGLEELLKSAYGGVNNMLNGKAWPKALKGLRMVCICLLEEHVISGENLKEVCTTASKYPTGKLWVSGLIEPVKLAHYFIIAMKENNILLNLYCEYKTLHLYSRSSNVCKTDDIPCNGGDSWTVRAAAPPTSLG